MAMTYEDLRAQLTWTPRQEGNAPATPTHAVLGGMGGSALPAYAARFLDPTLSLSVHKDYDLPEKILPNALHIAVSYSGNTAETLSFAQSAHARKLPLAIITSGGELAQFAHENTIPLISIPTGLQPRNALFYLLHSLCVLLNRTDISDTLSTVTFDANEVETHATALAQKLSATLPIFYTSRKNGFLAYYAKISFNETGKVPAYANLFSELNHNEMQSLDTMAPKNIVESMRFVLLRDANDDARMIKRMEVFTELMNERERIVLPLNLEGETRAIQLVRNSFYFQVAATAMANSRGIDPDAVPLIEDFKKRL